MVQTKVSVPSIFVYAVLFLIGYWMLFPKDVVAISGVPPMFATIIIALSGISGHAQPIKKDDTGLRSRAGALSSVSWDFPSPSGRRQRPQTEFPYPRKKSLFSNETHKRSIQDGTYAIEVLSANAQSIGSTSS
ncbi:hypothetical protein [Brevibacillus reuszeri]|uniref:hypothetical protein n=1 Tax=Brevibacillus reuszeri TaxID=54915 RepID=UPI003D206D05